MTDTTEMPEKIWADEVYTYSSVDDERAGGNELVPYVRDDTIPSKAEVAREFWDEIKKEAGSTLIQQAHSYPKTMNKVAKRVLKEWEDAESK